MSNQKLGDFATLTYGASLSQSVRKSGAIPVYGSNGVVGYHDEALSQGPAVLVGRKGSIGEVHYVPGPFWAIDTTYYVDSTTANCNLPWLAYFLKAQDLKKLNKATGVPGLNREDVHELPIEVPTPDQQKLIVEKLDHQFDQAKQLINRCAQQLEDVEQLGSAILRESFHEEIPIQLNCPSKVSGIGWGCKALLDVARLESGHTPSRRHPEWWGGDVPWLALPDIRKLHGKHAYETTEYTNDAGLANSSARLLPVGTVCLSRTASVGYATILGKPMATSQDFVNWVCDEDQLDPEFLMYAFMASREYLQQLGSGAVHKTIYMPTVQSFHICAPEISEQRRIARNLRERLAAAERLTAGLQERLAEIERLPQRLLAAAFAGNH